MGAVTSLVRRQQRALVTSEQSLEVQKDRQASPDRIPNNGAGVAGYVWDGKVPIQNAQIYRHWAKSSEWVRGAISIRRSQVSSAEWDVVPYDQRKPWSKRQQAALRELFRKPNPSHSSYRGFIEPVIDDLLTLDAGCIEKVRDLSGALREIWPTNAAQVRVNAMWDGDQDTARYYWYPDGFQEKARWRNDDFIYMMMNPRTDMPIGLPPLETLRAAVEAEMAAHEYNRRQVENAAPDGIINLGEGFTEPQVERFRDFFESEVAGRGPLGFIGGSKAPSFIKFRDTNRDQQFLEWQIYLVRKIAVVFGLTPQDLGVTFDVNRSTSEIQLQVSEDRGLRPLMSAVQESLTEEVVWDKSFGGSGNNLAFRFTALNLKESTAKAVIYEKALAGVPWRFINEARVDEGREPIPELEGKLIMATPTGAVDIMDMPTAREQLDAQTKKNEPPPSSSKEWDLGAIAQSLKTVLDYQRDSRDPVEVHIDKGAVEVNIDQPPISVDANTTIAEGAIRFVPTTYSDGAQHFEEGAVQLDQRPEVLVDQAPVIVEMGPVAAELEKFRQLLASVPPLQPVVSSMEVLRDDHGQITGRIKRMSDGTEIHETVRRDDAGRMIGIGPA